MHDSLVPSIERISSEEEPIVLPHLIHLLQDTVASGASVGFLPPLSAEQFYRTLGYCEVGVIPAYARGASGILDSTVIFYKTLPLWSEDGN